MGHCDKLHSSKQTELIRAHSENVSQSFAQLLISTVTVNEKKKRHILNAMPSDKSESYWADLVSALVYWLVVVMWHTHGHGPESQVWILIGSRLITVNHVLLCPGCRQDNQPWSQSDHQWAPLASGGEASGQGGGGGAGQPRPGRGGPARRLPQGCQAPGEWTWTLGPPRFVCAKFIIIIWKFYPMVFPLCWS